MTPSQPPARRVEVDGRTRGEFAAHYCDAFRVACVPSRRAAEWGRRSLRGAESAHGLFARLVWHGLLGFQLAAPGTGGTLAGWRIVVDEPERFVLESDGRLMAGRMVFELHDTAVTWTTMLRYHRPAARLIWAAAGYAHRALTPRCLDAARQSLERATPDRVAVSSADRGGR